MGNMKFKNTLYILVVFSLLVGCTDSKPTETNLSKEPEVKKGNESSDASNDPITSDKNLGFIINEEELLNLPRYFKFYDYIDENHFIGLTKNKPFIYSVKSHKFEIISETLCWNIKLSPDKNIITFDNEHGIGTINMKTGKEEMVFSREEMNKNYPDAESIDFVWGYNSDKLLLVQQFEWNANYSILNLENKKLKELNTKLEGYFLSAPIKWIDENRILFSIRALSKKDGTAEYSHGYRQDLALYDLRNDSYQKLTDAGDGEFLDYISNSQGVVYLRKSNSDNQSKYLSLDLNNYAIKETDLAEGNEIIYAFLNIDTYVIGQEEREKAGNNHVLNLFYVNKGNKYQLGKWGYDTSPPDFFIFENSLLISSGYKASLFHLSRDFSTDDVRWVYMTPPLPRREVNQPLFPDRDQDKIEQIIGWIRDAAPVDEQNLTSPIKGRSQALNLKLNNGDIIQIRPAWICKGEVDSKGNKGTSCTSVKNRVWISGWIKGDYFAKSEILYTFVTNTYKKWMPDAPLYKHPSRVQLDEPFVIEGNGWLTTKVVIEIKKGNQVFWSKEVIPFHGHFDITTRISDSMKAIKPGKYELSIKGVDRGIGSTIEILNYVPYKGTVVY
jgi:hypothetical protein